MIINGELETGLGGGVCQVSTTVFNAAFEAGLSITARTNHALYISHYPLGRDATVNYPDIDLQLHERHAATGCCLRTFVGTSSLTVDLYGTPRPPPRRVRPPRRSSNTGPIPVKKHKDPTLPKGTVEVETHGVRRAQATSVERKVYAPNGKLLYDTMWSLVLPLRADGASSSGRSRSRGRSETPGHPGEPIDPVAPPAPTTQH